MNTLETAIIARLRGGTALAALVGGTANPRIYNGAVPATGGSANYPCVMLAFDGGGDDNDNPHRSKDLRYSIKAMSTASMSAAGSIDDQIDALLHNAPLTVAGWTNIWAVRDRGVRYTETTDTGARYYHSGGIYGLRLSQ